MVFIREIRVKPAGSSDTDRLFREARYALADGEYEKAIDLFQQVIQRQPRNWAHYWLGCALSQQGKYEEAIKHFTKVIEIFKDTGLAEPTYCCLARGLAYASQGNFDKAAADINKALPSMILALQHPKEAKMFDYTSDPRHRGKKITEQQSLMQIVWRLRGLTEQNFGYDPVVGPEGNKQAIAAWQDWLEKTPPDQRVRLKPNVLLLRVGPPPIPSSPKEPGT